MSETAQFEQRQGVSDGHRAMPSNMEAEQALLGILLYENEALEGAEELTPGDFFEPFHGRLFAEISSRVTAGRIAEPNGLKDVFAEDIVFQEMGGVRYFADIIEAAPPPKYVTGFASTIKSAAMGRRLIQTCWEIEDVAGSGKLARDQLQAAEALLYQLADETPGANGFAAFSDVIARTLESANEAHMHKGAVTGLSTGLIDLDHKLGGLHPSDLLILAGRPSMGKTALATNIARHAARSGASVAFFSLEMSAEQLTLRMLAEETGISSDTVRKGHTTPMEMSQLVDAGREIERLPMHIDATGGLSISSLVGRARRLKRRRGLDLVVVDYLQLVTTKDRRRSGSRTEEVTEITQALKALAKELAVPVLALSQLSRQVENREDKRPQLSDLRESGSIEQDADAVLFVYRESYYLGRAEPSEGTPKHLEWQIAMDTARHQAEVIIGKQRHGPIGTVKLAFNDSLTKFGNLARESSYAGRDPYGRDG
jgi:replicative DNA helicase